MAKKINKFLYRSPRILSILFMIFLSLFSLDILDSNLSLGGIILGLIIHNIPTLILLVITIVAWKYEIVGAITFILVGLSYILLTAINGELARYLVLLRSMTIAGPAILTGILFLINRFKKRK